MRPTDVGGAIVATNVHRSFSGHPVLEDVTFVVRRGSFVGLTGPNGAGKTTLLRLIVGLLRLDGGSITVLGHDVSKDPAAVRRSTGAVIGAPTLDKDLTARETLQMAAGLRGMDARAADDRIAELAEALAFTSELRTLGGALSLGTRQKVALTRAILHGPSVLLLDEATTGLDAVSADVFESFLSGFRAEGATVLYASHRLDEVDRLADEVVFLDEGRMMFAGSRDDALRHTGAPDVRGAFLQLATANAARRPLG